MLSITKNNGQRANTFFPPSKRGKCVQEIHATDIWLSISMTLNPLPPTRISSYLNKVGHANIKWKGSKCFLAHKHACAKSFFFSQYSLHYSPWIFHFEGRRRLGRVESGNNRVCTMLKDKVGFSPVSLPCSYTGYLLWLMQQPHPPTPPKNIVCPAFISQSLKRDKSERKKAVSFLIVLAIWDSQWYFHHCGGGGHSFFETIW